MVGRPFDRYMMQKDCNKTQLLILIKRPTKSSIIYFQFNNDDSTHETGSWRFF
jgi:hypothetical protein